MGPAYVKSHGLSVITADGDRIDRKGAWTGGYHDVRRSRLESIERTKTLTERYETGSRRHAEVKRQLAVLDQSVTRIVGKIQIAEGKLRASRDGRAPIVDETLAAQKDEEQLRTRIETLEGNLAAATTAIASMRAQIVALEAERGTTMEGGLSAAEATSLKAMATQLETQKRDLVTATKKRSDVRAQLLGAIADVASSLVARACSRSSWPRTCVAGGNSFGRSSRATATSATV